MIEVQTQVSQNTEALKGAQTEVNELRRQIQTLEIELESQKSLVRNIQSAHTSFTQHMLILRSAMPKSALSLKVSCLLCWHKLYTPVIPHYGASATCKISTRSLSCSHRKPLWRAR